MLTDLIVFRAAMTRTGDMAKQQRGQEKRADTDKR